MAGMVVIQGDQMPLWQHLLLSGNPISSSRTTNKFWTQVLNKNHSRKTFFSSRLRKLCFSPDGRWLLVLLLLQLLPLLQQYVIILRVSEWERKRERWMAREDACAWVRVREWVRKKKRLKLLSLPEKEEREKKCNFWALSFLFWLGGGGVVPLLPFFPPPPF